MPRTSIPRAAERPVTQTDIARVVGCSQNTVALALRNSRRISEARRKEIVSVARRMGYHPSIAARTLRGGRSGLVGVCTGRFDSTRERYTRTIFDRLESTRFHPILGLDQKVHIPWYKALGVDMLRELHVEAIISFAWHDAEVTLPPWRRRTPIILSGFQPRPKLPCDVIAMDRGQATYMATQFLQERGHKRIAMVAGYEASYLKAGYLAAMQEAGLQPMPTLIDHRPNMRLVMNEYIERIARDQHRPTAAIVLPSPQAVDLINAATAAGMSVPDDLAVIGFDHLPWANQLPIPLTTIEQPIDDLVTHTLQALQTRLDHPSTPYIHKVLPFKLQVRAST